MSYYLGSFRPEFEKAIAIFEISNLAFAKMQSFILKNTYPWAHIVLLEYFSTRI